MFYFTSDLLVCGYLPPFISIIKFLTGVSIDLILLIGIYFHFLSMSFFPSVLPLNYVFNLRIVIFNLSTLILISSSAVWYRMTVLAEG